MDKVEQDYIKNATSEDRDGLIDEILLQYINQSNAKSRPSKKISFFIGGGSASGKSSFRKSLIEQDPDILVIDSDELKEAIPEYYELARLKPQFAASIVHKESSSMATKLLYKAVEQKISVMFDGTLKSPEKYQRFIAMLRDAGFTVTLVIVDVPVKIALERNRARYAELKEQGKTARLVPDDTVLQTHARIPGSFDALKDLVDEWMILDTRGNKDEVIAHSKEGKVQIPNEQLYKEFLNKGSIVL